MHITNLVRVHEARIAHHVAAVGEVDGQNGTASELDITRAVMMNVRILGRLKIAAVKQRFDPF